MVYDEPYVVHRSPAPYVVLGASGIMKNMHYVYVLRSLNHEWIYVGSTNSVKRRFQEHKRGEVQSTKPYRPFQLLFYEAFISKNDAIRRENYLKTSKGKSTLRMILRDSFQITESVEVGSD